MTNVTSSLRPELVRAIATVIALSLAAPAQADIVADGDTSAICAPTDDPCFVRDRVIASNTLDFGRRALHITKGGSIVVAPEQLAEVLCGDFVAEASSPTPIVVQGGHLDLRARGACVHDGALLCRRNYECDHQVGGTPVAGTCAGGLVDIAGRVNGRWYGFGGQLVIDANGDVVFRRVVDVSGLVDRETHTAKGGYVAVSSSGSVHVLQGMRGTGRMTGDSGPGSLSLSAGVDLFLEKQLRFTGGSAADAGILLSAGRDIVMNAQLRTNASSPDIYADRDLIIGAGRPARIQTTGSEGSDISADGERNLIVHPGSRFITRSAGREEATAGVIELGGGNIDFNGIAVCEGRGRFASGGGIQIQSEGPLQVGERARLRCSSGQGGSSESSIHSEGPMAIRGRVSVVGTAETLLVSSASDITVSGRIAVNGLDQNNLWIGACGVRIEAGGEISTRGTLAGISEIRARGQVEVAAGGSLLSPSGHNLIRYGDAAKPPILEGEVHRPPFVSFDPSIGTCP